jgi:proline dehydrogenase
VLRLILLTLSRSRIAQRVVTHMPGVRQLARRFVAGETQADALAAVRRLNAAGFEVTVSYLGEAVTTEAEVARAVDQLTSFARAVGTAGLRSHLSIKLSELGLAFDRALAARSLDAVIRAAADAGTFVRIDMEDSRYTAETLAIFREARRTHANAGVVIQSYLRRSAADMEVLAREGAPVRLVKGAYREPEDVAFQSKGEVDAAFVALAESYFAGMAPRGHLAVATHDERMVRAAIASAARHGRERACFEFQLLYGIRQDLQRTLRREGYTVRVYVPYGDAWYPYLMRRLAERPANLWFFLRAASRR